MKKNDIKKDLINLEEELRIKALTHLLENVYGIMPITKEQLYFLDKDLILLYHEEGLGGDLPLQQSVNSTKHIFPADTILKRDCLKIVSEAVFKQGNAGSDDCRDFVIRTSQKFYEELKASGWL